MAEVPFLYKFSKKWPQAHFSPNLKILTHIKNSGFLGCQTLSSAGEEEGF